MDPFYVLRGSAHDEPVQSLCFRPISTTTTATTTTDDTTGGWQLWTGDAGGRIVVWDSGTMRPSTFATTEPQGILRLRCCCHHRLLISQDRGNMIRIWDLSERRKKYKDPTTRWTCKTESLYFCKFDLLEEEGEREEREEASCLMACISPTNASLMDVYRITLRTTREEGNDDDLSISLVQSGIGELPSSEGNPQQQQQHCMCLCIGNPSSVTLFSGYEDGSVRGWDMSSKTMLFSSKLHAEPLLTLCFDERHQQLYTGSADSLLHRYSPSSNAQPSSLQLKSPGVADIQVRRHDGRILAVACWDNTVRIFSTKSWKPLAVLRYHRDGVNAVAFAPQGGIVAAASKDRKISLWNVY